MREFLGPYLESIPAHQLAADIVKANVAYAVVEARHALGMTRKAFAERLGVSVRTLALMESAEYNLTVEDLCRLATARVGIDVSVSLESNPASGNEIERAE